MQSDEQSHGNPFDFRSPVRHRALLAGRQNELQEVDELLRESALGRPVHLSLFGNPGNGKSSLLNGVADLALERGLLAVKLGLREATVDTELDFYKALYDTALQALLDGGQLRHDDELMRTWTLLTCTGHLPSAISDIVTAPLELGLLFSAHLNGKMVTSVPTALIRRDVHRLLTIGGETLLGLVLCIDSAEMLDRNNDLSPSLLQLTDSTPLVTIVTAAERAGSLQRAAPRAWAQIEVGPFRTIGGVLDAITKPVNYAGDTLHIKPPTPATAMDIRELTDGVPYEVNLVCHFIWDAITQGEQDGFSLSPAVIERVATELEEKGRHQVRPEIETFSSLSATDYELLAELAPYERLTVRQLALMRLMLADYSEDELSTAVDLVERQLSDLRSKDVINIEHDRFQVRGSRDARLYLKYAVQRHTDRKLHYGNDYPTAASVQCATKIGETITRRNYSEGLMMRLSQPHDGEWLDALKHAAATHNVVALSEQLGVRVNPQDVAQQASGGFVLMTLNLRISRQEVALVDLVTNIEQLSLEEINFAAQEWTTQHRGLLEKYEIEEIDFSAYEIPLDVMCRAVAYGHLDLTSSASYALYRAGAPKAAEELVAQMLDLSRTLVGSDPGDILLRTKLADAWSRHGFMAASRQDWSQARERLELSQRMASTEAWLLDYNLAYIRAGEGDLEKAVALASQALQTHRNPPFTILLHAYFPTPDDWLSSSNHWNVVELQGNWIKRFLDLQLLVLRACESKKHLGELKSALKQLSGSSPAPILRLAAWSHLTLLKDPTTAGELFARAVATTPYDEADLPRVELDFSEKAI